MALADRKIEQGHRRVLPHADPCAVAWWFVHREDGFVFARGGRCRTSKLARSLIHRAAIQAREEFQAIPREVAAHRRRSALRRPT